MFNQRRETRARLKGAIGVVQTRVRNTTTAVCEAMEPRRLLSASFVPSSSSTSVPGATAQIAAAHFNGPLNPISLAVVTSDSVQILKGVGDGTFTSASSIALPPNPASGSPFLYGGFNGGNLDAVLLSQDSTTHNGVITYEKGNNDGTFTAGSTTLIMDGGNGFDPISACVADVNGDSEADLLVIGKPNTGSQLVLAIMLSNGSGGFSEATDIPLTGSNAAASSFNEYIAAADLGNGATDIVIVDDTGGHLLVLVNNGDGTGTNYTEKTPVSLTAQQVVGGLFDASGHIDLVAANGNQLTFLKGDGAGGFAPQTPITLSAPVTGMAAGDVDGDGNTDLVTNVGVLLGNGDGTFQSPVPLPLTFQGSGNLAASLVLTDVNGDNKPDVVGLLASGNAVQAALNGSAAATTTTVHSNANPVTAGGLLQLTATVTSTSGTPTGNVEFFDGSTDLGGAVLSNGTANFPGGSTTIVGDHQIRAEYLGGGSFLPSLSAALDEMVTSSLVVLFSAKAPPGVLAGQKASITSTANLINNGGVAVSGTLKEALYLAPGTTVDSASVLLTTASKRVNLAAGKSIKFAIKATKIPISAPNGTYHVVLELTEPDGTKIDAADSGSVTVTPAHITLAGSFASVHNNIATITVASTGNVTASGLLPITVESSPDNQPADASLILNFSKKIAIRSGKSTRITFKLTNGTYYLIVRLDPNSTFPAVTDPNTTFNTASPITVR